MSIILSSDRDRQRKWKTDENSKDNHPQGCEDVAKVTKVAQIQIVCR
jgi:hypothetical protein